MCPSHCNTSVSVYGISVLREPGWVGRLSERRDGCLLLDWAERRCTAKGNVWTWPRCPFRSHQASHPLLIAHIPPSQELPRHPGSPRGHPRRTPRGVPLAPSGGAGAPWYLACTLWVLHPHPACHPSALPACWGRTGQRGGGGDGQKGKHTAASSSGCCRASRPPYLGDLTW